MKTKGAPEVVYGQSGVPLILPLDAELADVRAETGIPGRYRLDPVDENNKPIANAPAGYICVHETTEATSPAVASVRTADSIVIEAMRMNSEIAKTVVDRFPQMLEAAATLLRAADGAGLPARPGTIIDVANTDDDEDDEVPTAPAGFDIAGLITQMMPLLLNAFSGVKKADVASVLDWRKAAKPAPEKSAAPKPESTALPPLDPVQMAHVIAIQAQLEPNEVAFVQEVAKDLAPAELRDWFDKLSKQTVPDAVATIRGLINGKKGGDS